MRKKWKKVKKDNANGCITSCCRSEKRERNRRAETAASSCRQIPPTTTPTTTTTNGKEMCCGKYFLFHFHYVHEFMMYPCVHNVRALARAQSQIILPYSPVSLVALSFHSPYIIIRSSRRLHFSLHRIADFQRRCEHWVPTTTTERHERECRGCWSHWSKNGKAAKTTCSLVLTTNILPHNYFVFFFGISVLFIIIFVSRKLEKVRTMGARLGCYGMRWSRAPSNAHCAKYSIVHCIPNSFDDDSVLSSSLFATFAHRHRRPQPHCERSSIFVRFRDNDE